MEKELNSIINQINEHKKKGTVLFTEDNNSFYDYKEKIKEELDGKCVFFQEDFLNISGTMANIHDYIESAKLMFKVRKIDKAIIFIDNIELISDEKRINANNKIRLKEARFLIEVDKIPSDLNIFLLMQSSSNVNLDEAFLRRFYVVGEKQKSLDELLDKGKSFKEINNIYKDKNNER